MRTLRAVFVMHGLITLAGAVVLTVFPTAIPSAVGITLERADYLLVYLVAAAELAVAVLSFGAAGLTDRRALGLIVTTLVVLHLASGIPTCRRSHGVLSSASPAPTPTALWRSWRSSCRRSRPDPTCTCTPMKTSCSTCWAG